MPLSRLHLTTLVPAKRDERQLIDRGLDVKDMRGDYLEHGVTEKSRRYTEMSQESRVIYKTNFEKSIYTDMKRLIYAPQKYTPLPFSR